MPAINGSLSVAPQIASLALNIHQTQQALHSTAPALNQPCAVFRILRLQTCCCSAEATTIVTHRQRHESEHERECWCGYRCGYKCGYRCGYRCGYKCGCKCGGEGKSAYLSARSDVVHQLWHGRSDGSVMLLKRLAHTLQDLLPLLMCTDTHLNARPSWL